jgi:NADH-quinone oxidoreductase subunit N
MFEMLLLMQYWPNPNILFLNYNGFIIILVGLFFKLGIVPFHMWYIDTYDSTDFTILLFLSTAPKYGISLYLCSWFGFLHLDRSNIILDLIYICSFLSIFIGTFGGLFQLNIKRFFIYSSISHMGFMLTSLLLKWPLNIILFCMYIFVYILIYFCLLLAKMVAKDRTTNFIIKHIYNLHSIFISNRALTFSICSFLIILTSLPPFVLFYIKFLVLTTLIDHFEFLIVWALLVLNIVGAYIYIRITTHILFRKISDSCFVFLSIPNKYISFFISFMVFFNLFSFLNFPVFIFLLFVFIG